MDSLAAGGGAGGAAAQQLTVGLQQLHAAVGASLKERPTTTAVRAMIEERSKENDLVARVSALEAEADASANAEGAGEGERRALETINAVSRRVGVLEDNSHAMERRRQQRTERVVEDVRRALDARRRDERRCPPFAKFERTKSRNRTATRTATANRTPRRRANAGGR